MTKKEVKDEVVDNVVEYRVLDSRTGYEEGTIIKVSIDELHRIPFNVHCYKIPSNTATSVVQDGAGLLLLQELRAELLNRGLSPKRTEKVLKQFSSIEDLTANVESVSVDKLTDEWVKKEFPKKGKKKIKKIKSHNDEVINNGIY